jgi:hypothetical protein
MRISRFLQGSFVMLTLIVAPAAMIGITASAAGAQGARAVPDTSPAGYSIQSARFTANAGEQSTDAVDCPDGTVPWGGGAEINERKLGASLNSSVAFFDPSGPGPNGWEATVDNTTGSNLAFVVYAVCADEPTGYAIVGGSSQTDPAKTRAGTFAACPSGTVSLGGGGFVSASNISVSINGIEPILSEGIYNFEVYMNNDSESGSSFIAQVVCGKKPAGYVTKSASMSNPSRKDSSAHADCPANTVVVGGGVLSTSINLAVDVNATVPDSDTKWLSYVDNGSASSAMVKSYAICAK